jgi:hypothetical protein
MVGARVTSLEALVEFRAALATFLERARSAVGSLRQETHRTLLWLEQEQPRYWAEEVRRAFDRVAAARGAYDACRLRTVAGHRSACIEEQQALRKAQRRVEYCQSQVDVVRRWSQTARDQGDEFFGKIGPLERMLEHEVPLMIALMERMIDSIEAYVAVGAATEGDLLESRAGVGAQDAAGEVKSAESPVDAEAEASASRQSGQQPSAEC